MKRTKELRQLLKLMFDPGEKVCAAPDRFQTTPKDQSEVTIDDTYITLNPLEEGRKKENVTAFRTFLLEIDPAGWDEMNELEKEKALANQLDCMKNVPYSARIFSGNKSYHFLVVMDRPLSEESYKAYATHFSELIQEVDPGVKNCVTAVRTPGHFREETGKFQTLEEIRGRVSLDDLFSWFDSFPPDVLSRVSEKAYGKIKSSEEIVEPECNEDRGWLNRRTRDFLEEGVPLGSNWHTERNLAALDLMSQNFPIEEAEEILSSITGSLDETDLYQIKWCYDNGVAADFRPIRSRDGGRDD